MRRIVVGSMLMSVVAAGAMAPAVVGKSSKPKRGAKVLHATLRPVPVGDYGQLAQSRGKAQLVDGPRRNNKLTIQVRGLRPGVTYPWHLHRATGAGNPCNPADKVGNPAPFPGWTYRALRANRAGNASSKGTAARFKVDSGPKFYVNVHLPTGEPFLCGVLKSKRKAKPKPKSRGKRHRYHARR